MQDNKSTISLVTRGGAAPRNKLLRVQQNLVKQAIEMKQIEVEYISTREMIADSLTKPLQGALLNVLNDKTMGKMASTSGLKRWQGCTGKTMIPGIRNTQATKISTCLCMPLLRKKRIFLHGKSWYKRRRKKRIFLHGKS